VASFVLRKGQCVVHINQKYIDKRKYNGGSILALRGIKTNVNFTIDDLLSLIIQILLIVEIMRYLFKR